jgi:hypothetical protein
MANFVESDHTLPPIQIQMNTVGMLLETWNTLNVQAEPYQIDSFTFDDFVDAMGFTTESENTECQLLNEAFCAVMKQLVDDKGDLQVTLPQMAEEASEDSSESAIDDSTVSTPVADVPARSTRSRLSHVENASEQPQSPIGPPVKTHKAQEALALFGDWKEALGSRDLAGGNWQVVLVGLLYQLSHAPAHKANCDKILAYLVPLDMDPSKENIRFQFKTMDINLRAAALQPLTLLSTTTEALKSFYESCSEDQTKVRKTKMEAQRQKKADMESMAYKTRDRTTAQEELSEAEAAEAAAAAAIADATAAGSSEPEDEPVATTGRGTRQSLKRKRGGELTAQEKERKATLDAAKAVTDKKRKALAALVRDSESLRSDVLKLEASIAEHDNDLREADVQRTRLLGKDRFCNRYYWFERNGQPFGGLPTSSTADYGYSNGRLWVQGPDAMELEGFIDLPENEQAVYKAKHQVTVPERRKIEEGPTSLRNANEWGYYDDPTVLEPLIGWLDDRGEREKKLRKELYEWRDKISRYMRIRKEFLDGDAARKLEAEEEPKKGIATRRQAEQEKAEAGERCLRWRNTMAIEELGHIHSEGVAVKKSKKQKTEKTAPAAAAGRTSRSRAK